jgi:hypothetical protein
VNVFDYASVSRATRRLDEYYADLIEKADELCERLAEIAQDEAAPLFYGAMYDGINDVEVYIEPIDNGYAVKASGDAAMFIEFGSGASYGYGHPEPEGYGPGTYPGKGHWDDPNGWWYGNHEHSYGNPPAQAMYNAKREIQAEVQRIADEVFNT